MNTNPQRTWSDYLWIGARGLAMGTADIIPGVSGGTMAFILGIYEELLDAIHAFNLTFLRRLFSPEWRQALAEFPWKFLLSLLSGIFLAILSLSRALHWALENKPELVWAFFFGLVAASILVVRRRVKTWSFLNLMAALLSAAGAYVLVGLTPAETPHTPLLLFLSGALAICAMILPGISGAFILVLLGKYRYILGAVKNFDLFPLFLVACGAVIGLVAFVRLLRWMLHKNHDLVVAILTGFMLGSLRKVWPWKIIEPMGEISREINVLPAPWSGEVLVAILLMILGVTVVLVIENLANRRETA